MIVECETTEQRDRALKIRLFGRADIVCFSMRDKPTVKGVISGVPIDVEAESFHEVEGVCGARRLKSHREGKEQDSSSVLIEFVEALPERVYLDYVSYRVRAFERGPLRCYWCQEYGYVAVVCRRGRNRCRRYGKEGCSEEDCKLTVEQAVCLHCGGNHKAGAKQCERRIKESKIERTRVKSKISYAEATRRVREEKGTGRKEPDRSGTVGKQRESLIMDRRRFLPFISMVLNCASEIETKSERIKMVVHAAKEILGIFDVKGDEIHKIFEKRVWWESKDGDTGFFFPP